MKVFSLIAVFYLSLSFAQEEVAYENPEGNQYYYYEDAECCNRCYRTYRRPSCVEEKMYRNLTESNWPGKRQDSIIEEVKR